MGALSNVKKPVEEQTVTDLKSTVGSITSKIQKQLDEKQQALIGKAIEKKAREERVLQALTTIRKALEATCKIRLGDRFHLSIEVADVHGWPRIWLLLVDHEAPERKDFALIVAAHDRNDAGVIEFRDQESVLMSRISLAEESAVRHLSRILKNTVRIFLTNVADYVVAPKSSVDLVGIANRSTIAPEHDPLVQADLFSPDVERPSNVLKPLESNPAEPGTAKSKDVTKLNDNAEINSINFDRE
jgi:hypothetical protein